MDFDFSSEQLQLAETLQRWAARDYGFEQRRNIIGSEEGVSERAWTALADLGVLALPVPQQQGGFDGSTLDLFVVMRELGRALVVEPYFATVLGAHFLKLGGVHAAQLEQVASGELKLACALNESAAGHELFAPSTTLTPAAGGYLLKGSKCSVVHGAQAGMLVVSARGPDGLGLVLVPRDAAGVRVSGYRCLDGQRAASIVFDDVAVPLSALIGGADVLDAAADHGAALLCADALGAMEALFSASLEYLKTRSQFGAPIGKFQALQHRMADMYIHLEQARSMALLAAVRADSADAGERRRAVSAAKYRIGQALTFIGQQAVQLHGGMGVTDELPAAHHFKRLTMIGQTLGDASHHLRRFMAQPECAAEAAA